MTMFAINPFTGQFDEVGTSGGGTGDVVGPGSSTDNAVVRFDGTTGKLIQNSVAILSDAGILTGLTGLTVTGPTTLNGAQIVKLTSPGAYPYTVLVTDYIVLVDTSSARTIRLPDAPTAPQVFVIKDNVGLQGANNTTLTTVGGVVTIDGAASVSITTNWTSVAVVFNGTSYRVI